MPASRKVDLDQGEEDPWEATEAQLQAFFPPHGTQEETFLGFRPPRSRQEGIQLITEFHHRYPATAPMAVESIYKENVVIALATLLRRSLIFDHKIYPRADFQAWEPWKEWAAPAQTYWRNRTTHLLCNLEEELKCNGVPKLQREQPLREMVDRLCKIFQTGLQQPSQPLRAAWTGILRVDQQLFHMLGRTRLHHCEINLDGLKQHAPTFRSLQEELLPDIIQRTVQRMTPAPGPVRPAPIGTRDLPKKT